MSGLDRRLRRLEQRQDEQQPACGPGMDLPDIPELPAEQRGKSTGFWRLELLDFAAAVVCDYENPRTIDAEGTVRTLGGKLIASRWGHIRVDAMFEVLGTVLPKARWSAFIETDDEAFAILEDLKSEGRLAEEPPPDFADDFADGFADDFFPYRYERDVRALAWLLATDEDALELLVELYRRRDAFVHDDDNNTSWGEV